MSSKNIFKTNSLVDRSERYRANGHCGCVVWLTGLSGSGKSTVSQAVEKKLFQSKHQVCILDGDNLRHGLNSDLGFSPQDRKENIRRVAELAVLMANIGTIVLVAFISPYKEDRALARQIALKQDVHFVEVYVNASLKICESRDVKGLYARARSGEIKDFTGVDAPYEPPDKPSVTLNTDKETVHASVDKVISILPLMPF